MKLFLIGGMEDLNFNYCYKITYESGETYDRRRNELSVEISKEDYKKIITGVLQERPIDQIEGISDVIDKMTENVEFADRFMNKNGSLRKHCKLCLNGMPVPLLRNCYSIFNGTKYR